MKGTCGTLLMLMVLIVLVAGLVFYARLRDQRAWEQCASLGYPNGYEQLLTGKTYCWGKGGVKVGID